MPVPVPWGHSAVQRPTTAVTPWSVTAKQPELRMDGPSVTCLAGKLDCAAGSALVCVATEGHAAGLAQD